jgi:hypothetical protein
MELFGILIIIVVFIFAPVLMGAVIFRLIADEVRYRRQERNGDVNMTTEQKPTRQKSMWEDQKPMTTEQKSTWVACIAGAALATAIGYSQWYPHTKGMAHGGGFQYWLTNTPMDVLMWAAVGAIVAWAALYGYRTLTKKEGEQNNA